MRCAARLLRAALLAVLLPASGCRDAASTAIPAPGAGEDLETLQARVARNPGDARLLDRYAEQLVNAGRVAEAHEILRRCVAAEPDFAPGWNHLGVTQAMLGDTAGARRSWERAVALDPQLSRARMNLAELALRAGEPETAVRHFAAVTARNGGDVRAWNGLGEAALAMGDYPRARDAFAAAVRVQPGNAAAWLGLGEAHLRTDEFAEARRALARAREHAPADPRAALFQALAVVEDPANVAGLEAAEGELRGAVERRFMTGQALYGLGVAAMRRGEPADAVVYFRRAAEADPSNERVLYRLGRALLATGRLAEGRREMDRYHRLFRLRQEVTALRLRAEVSPEDPGLKRRLAAAEAKLARAR